MIEGIEPLYQQIADSIQDAIEEPWSSAWIDAIFYSEHTRYSGEYLVEGGTPQSFPTTLEGERAFERIRELFIQAGKPVWCRARFEIHADGRFNMNWGYDDCDEHGYAIFDEEAELKRMRERLDRGG
jgi:hypothetical protein